MVLAWARKHRDHAAAAVLLPAALAAYGWKLGGKSLWVDEALSLEFARQGVGRLLSNTWETNPPLYYLLLTGWVKLCGASEAALRSMSVLFALAAVFLLARLALWLGGPRLAWPAAGLLALSPMPVMYAQTARGYSLYLAAAILSFDSLLRWERERTRRWAVAYVVATALMLYGHNYGVFNFAAQQLWMGWLIARRRVPLLRWGAIAGTALLAFSPWLAVQVIQSLSLSQRGFWIPRPAPGDLVAAFRGFFLWWGLPPSLALIHLALAVAGALAFLGVGRRKVTDEAAPGAPQPAAAGLLLLWLLFPGLLAFGLSLVATPIFWDRYLFASVPAAYLLAGRGVTMLPGRPLRAALTALLLLLALAGLRGYYPWQIEDWRGLAAEVEAGGGPGDILALTPSWTKPGLDYYYRGPLEVRTLPDEVQKIRARSLRAAGRLWLVSRSLPGKPPPVVELLRRKLPRARFSERSYGYLLRLFIFEFPDRGRRPALR